MMQDESNKTKPNTMTMSAMQKVMNPKFLNLKNTLTALFMLGVQPKGWNSETISLGYGTEILFKDGHAALSVSGHRGEQELYPARDNLVDLMTDVVDAVIKGAAMVIVQERTAPVAISLMECAKDERRRRVRSTVSLN